MLADLTDEDPLTELEDFENLFGDDDLDL